MASRLCRDAFFWPGNANLPIGVVQSANREIGVPSFQPNGPRGAFEIPRKESAPKWGKAKFAEEVECGELLLPTGSSAEG
jgi:hypothetical protein